MNDAPLLATDSRSLPALRRRDRAVEDDGWIADLLQRTAVGSLSTVRDGWPMTIQNLFVYDPTAHCIILHSARAGATFENLQHDPRVCFACCQMGSILPAPRAFNFSSEFESVVVFGTASLVTDQRAYSALQLICDKYAPHLRPGRDYEPADERDLKKTAVLEVAIERWTGKRKQAPGHPGAYRFGDWPTGKSAVALLDRE
jgi:hypothetical protein